MERLTATTPQYFFGGSSMEQQYFRCYSRKLMYFLGLHDINYVDKFYNETNGKPYWTFNYTPELEARLDKWELFKEYTQIK